jgi:hypothetical protein
MKYTYWLTPEELCDIVERYADLLEVQYAEGSCPRSEDMAYVRLFQKSPPEGNPIEFTGMFAFPSQSDAANYWQEIDRNPRLATVIPRLANIQGKWHLNFQENYGNPRDVTYKKEREIQPGALWHRICARQQRLRMPGDAPSANAPSMRTSARTSQPVQARAPQSPRKRWWQFWR